MKSIVLKDWCLAEFQAGPGVAFVPSSPLEESLLCLLLTVELSPEVITNRVDTL
jgi:hypothetical protein